MKKIMDGWTTEDCWRANKLDKGGAIDMLGAFTTKSGYWEPFEKMVKIRITVEEID